MVQMDDVREYIRFLSELGITEVPAQLVPQGNGTVDAGGPSQPDDSGTSSQDVHQHLATMEQQVATCTRCPLSEGRTRTVFGEGDVETDLMFIGEGPGYDEDQQGRPFVGKAGQLLEKIINAIGLAREDVYITNIVKCRPPRNRDPLPEEVSACWPYITEQIRQIKPKVIVTLGRHSSQTILGTGDPISRLRGRFSKLDGIPVMPTYHPAYLLRNPAGKRDVWEDVQKVRDYLKAHGTIYERTRFGTDTGSDR